MPFNLPVVVRTIMTSNYKMKIVACFFHENQKKLVWEARYLYVGLHDYYKFIGQGQGHKATVTDDALQHEHKEVACVKSIIYKQYLPSHVKKVRFTLDGAGSFKSQFH
jgi:hypothetical protein